MLDSESRQKNALKSVKKDRLELDEMPLPILMNDFCALMVDMGLMQCLTLLN